MPHPIVALLSDFGTRDHYVGAMKGVILGLNPEVMLVDITHDIDPHDVVGGALELAAAYRFFPAGTIFLAVVDPGVGSSRRGLAAEAGDYRFVGPDNGVLAAVFAEILPKRMVDISDRRYIRPTVSRTFEGRDRFAPAAAWLTKGIQLSALGRPVTVYGPLDIPVSVEHDDRIEGEILRVDRFGNLVSNIDRKAFERFGEATGVGIVVGDTSVERLVATYAEMAPEETAALFGSTDHLEIAVRESSAAQRLGLGRGAHVRVFRR